MATVAAPVTGAQRAAKGFGIFYMALGVVGFLFTFGGPFIGISEKSLLGLVNLNHFHNIVHIGFGALTYLGGRISDDVARGTMIGAGSVYLIAIIIGWPGSLHGLLNVEPGIGTTGIDLGNIFHGASALFLFAMGFGGAGRTAAA